MGASVGGGHSKSGAESIDSVWNTQGEALGDLYNSAQGLWGSTDNSGINNSGQWGADYANNIANSSMPGWNQQMSGGFTDPALRNSLMQSMQNPSATGQMYQSIVGGAGNSYIDPMVEAQNQSMQEQYDRFGKPNQDMAAESSGQSGSARHGVSQFLGQNQVNMDKLRNEMNLRGNAYDTDLNWKMGIAQQADAGRGDAQDRAISMLNQQNLAQQGALNFGQGMQDIGTGGFDIQKAMSQVPWDQLMQYANTLGAPTVLNAASSSDNARGANVSASYGGGKGG